MRKALVFLLALALFALVGCTGEGEAVAYDAAHEHVYGFWYEAQGEDGVRHQVRYCKICHAEQVQTVPQGTQE